MGFTAHDSALSAFGRALVSAASFEAAAEVTLRAMLDAAAEGLTQGPFAQRARVLRGVIHVRPADGYRGLAVLEAHAPTLSAPEAHGKHLSSTTAWRWIAATRDWVAIDVHVGRITCADARSEAAATPASDRPAGDFQGAETRLGLIARDTTHVLVLALRGPLGAVDGMIAIEAACQAAIGAPPIWADAADRLQTLADLAAPYLAHLPDRRDRTAAPDPFLPVVGPSMSGIVDMLSTFARQEEPILLTGPTGSGKSRLARFCHERSARRGKPFEVVDLCAIPETLQLAELFGWRKGAFTGAVRDTPGAIARAKGGTVFIDEIDSLSARAQAGLLRVLEEHAYRRLGDDASSQHADVRFIVGTHANLQSAVRERRFREDLYYRINVLPVKLPPLRERAEEIPMWARFMVERRHAAAGADTPVRLTTEAERTLSAHDWPGNLRQLDNIVRRAYALSTLDGERGARVLDERHVRRAMTYENNVDARSLVDTLIAAADAFVREAERRGPGAIDLDAADAFKGFVLATATERFGGDRDQAFALFGRDKVAKSRNHHKVLRRELDRVEALCRALGERRLPFASVLEPESDDAEPGDEKESGGGR